MCRSVCWFEDQEEGDATVCRLRPWRNAVNKITTSCPAVTCRAADAPQEPVSAATLSKTQPAGAWAGDSALRCSHCGCLYSVAGEVKTIHGYLDNPVIGGGFRQIFS